MNTLSTSANNSGKMSLLSNKILRTNQKLVSQNKEKDKRARKLSIANKELAFQNKEKAKRAAELIIANKELAFQNEEKEKRAAELILANEELAFQSEEKEKREAELVIANKELAFQNKEKEKRAAELLIALSQLKNEQEALRESEANLRTIFDNTTNVFILVDRDLKIVSFNKGAFDGLSKDLGKTLEVGKDIIDLIDEEKKQRTLEMYSRVFEGAQFKLEDSYTAEGGHVLWFDMHLLPVYGDTGKVDKMIVYLSEITKRKTAEREREKITLDLIQRIKELEQFSYIISHNLRLPVANIIGLVDNFTLNQLTGVEQKEVTSAIRISTKRLDDVIIDLNKILHIRNDRSENKEILKLSDILYSAKVTLGYLIKKENAIIEDDFSEIDEIFTVKSYISSIFYNLILNSIKYRKPELSPHIMVKSKKTDNSVVISFRDNGLGLNLAGKGEEMFGLYKRFHTHVSGKGMGLFMIKKQVEVLGGKLSVESEVNKGTTFNIELEQ
jgi:PAS domain S-box-containing protein